MFRRSNVHDVQFSIGEVEDEDGRWRWLWGEWDCFQKKRLGDTFVAIDREYDSFWFVDFVSIMQKLEKLENWENFESEMLFRRSSNVRDVQFSIGEMEDEDDYGENEIVFGRRD